MFHVKIFDEIGRLGVSCNGFAAGLVGRDSSFHVTVCGGIGQVWQLVSCHGVQPNRSGVPFFNMYRFEARERDRRV